MKPKNFPERKNQKRKTAYNILINSPYFASKHETQKAAENTLNKIVENARDVRSKKSRSM